jgi:ubiquinone/menaquinone biosynthesis C-methylase UbiE
MRKFMFTSNEIDTHKSDFEEWYNFVSRREVEIAFSLFKMKRFNLALELGAGDGEQSLTISKYCNKLICTEKDEKSFVRQRGQSILQRKMQNVEYALCDAQDLSRFPDRTFDLIFSSNMLEHITDVNKCFQECRRVLKDDGLMMHSMPNRWWKLFSSAISVAKFKRPGIHGVSSNQLQEFYVFGPKIWQRRIELHGLRVIEIVGLPFYVGHGNTCITVIKLGNSLELSASFLYIINKSKDLSYAEGSPADSYSISAPH